MKSVCTDTNRLIYHCSGLNDETSCATLIRKETKIYGLVHLAGIFLPDNMVPGDVEKIFDPVMDANIRNIYMLYAGARNAMLKEPSATTNFGELISLPQGSSQSYCLQCSKGSIGWHDTLVSKKRSTQYPC